MAKKKAGKAAAKGKARTKKASVKKRPAKKVGARKSKSAKGGVAIGTSRSPSLASEATNSPGPVGGDTLSKLQ
jgi:hypothetical protein